MIPWLRARAALILALGVFVGLVLPGLAHALRPWLALAVAGLLYTTMVRIEPAAVLHELRQWPRVLLVLLWLQAASPLITAATLALLPVRPELRDAIVLMSAGPPIMSAPAFGLLVGLDGALLLAVVLGATVLAPFDMTIAHLLLSGAGFALAPGSLALRLCALIGGCLAAAALTRALAGAARVRRAAQVIDLALVGALLFFAIAIMDGVTARLLYSPVEVALIVLAAFAANLALQALGAVVFARAGWRRAGSIGFATGNRNMGLWLAVMPPASAPLVALYFALAQLPIYVLPAALGRLYARGRTAEADR